MIDSPDTEAHDIKVHDHKIDMLARMIETEILFMSGATSNTTHQNKERNIIEEITENTDTRKYLKTWHPCVISDLALIKMRRKHLKLKINDVDAQLLNEVLTKNAVQTPPLTPR